ncbi:hypothetical protein NHP22001_14990 [Helicobacter sp. NHP22-001]|nr:hypothetical protein NHP22001_14990 [Helicobacter sp. NHP22-001]
MLIAKTSTKDIKIDIKTSKIKIFLSLLSNKADIWISERKKNLNEPTRFLEAKQILQVRF